MELYTRENISNNIINKERHINTIMFDYIVVDLKNLNIFADYNSHRFSGMKGIFYDEYGITKSIKRVYFEYKFLEAYDFHNISPSLNQKKEIHLKDNFLQINKNKILEITDNVFYKNYEMFNKTEYLLETDTIDFVFSKMFGKSKLTIIFNFKIYFDYVTKLQQEFKNHIVKKENELDMYIKQYLEKNI